MLRYIGRRLLQTIPVFFGATFLIFAMVYLMPGDPVAALGGDRGLSEAAPGVSLKAGNREAHFTLSDDQTYSLTLTNTLVPAPTPSATPSVTPTLKTTPAASPTPTRGQEVVAPPAQPPHKRPGGGLAHTGVNGDMLIKLSAGLVIVGLGFGGFVEARRRRSSREK